jgi:hypothetical protein
MIRLTQTKMKIHHASSIRPIKNKLFTDEKILQQALFSIKPNVAIPANRGSTIALTRFHL